MKVWKITDEGDGTVAYLLAESWQLRHDILWVYVQAEYAPRGQKRAYERLMAHADSLTELVPSDGIMLLCTFDASEPHTVIRYA